MFNKEGTESFPTCKRSFIVLLEVSEGLKNGYHVLYIFILEQ